MTFDQVNLIRIVHIRQLINRVLCHHHNWPTIGWNTWNFLETIGHFEVTRIPGWASRTSKTCKPIQRRRNKVRELRDVEIMPKNYYLFRTCRAQNKSIAIRGKFGRSIQRRFTLQLNDLIMIHLFIIFAD